MLVIGTGFSGLLAAIKLSRPGSPTRWSRRTRASAAPGSRTRYPGCGVDTPTHLYSLSFAQRPDWSRYFAKRDELHAYLEQLVDEHGLRSTSGSGPRSPRRSWDEDAQRWRVEASPPRGGGDAHANA